MGTPPTKICRLEAISKGYPAGTPSLITKLLCDGLLRRRPLGLEFLIVPDPSLNEVKLANGQPIDRAYRSRTARIFVPFWALLSFCTLAWAIADDGDVVAASILFAGAVLGLIRLRWPRDTWPVWLFSYKP